VGLIGGHSLKCGPAILEKYIAMTRASNAAATAELAETWIASVRMK
jgi:hypothetical protein